jgi:phosphoribosylaminoimidazole-succinocarboxamide synthase
MNCITSTQFQFPNQTSYYKGKVRDVYTIDNRYLVMIVTDRISAFDVVLPKGIPYKGQVLNQIANKFLQATSNIVPNWVLASPDAMVTVGKMCEPFKVEMVIRGYLSGHAWREYKSGKRIICGVAMPNGMKENDAFPQPIITPTTKAAFGHDEDISREEILNRKIVSEEDYSQLEKYAHALYKKGSEMANEMGLILVDTKYEFGKANNQIYLIDEIHTPDSSRYFYKEGYTDRQARSEAQKQLSKEFVREWLMANGFQGKDEQQIPEMTEDIIKSISERYIELFENITGNKFEKHKYDNAEKRIEKNVVEFLNKLK